MTTKHAEKWLVVAMAVILWSGRVAGQQVPSADKKPAEKRVETKAPRGDEQPLPDSPEGRRTPRPDFFGPDDRPPPGGFPGGFRRPGAQSRGPRS